MALVMLPCELPWWGTVQKHLNKLSGTRNTLELIEGMRKIHDLCNISLDPDDEENTDAELFIGLLNFLDNEMTSQERSNFLNNTLQNIIKRALNLKKWKPRSGLHFSLQQQPDSTELDYNFISSLIANAFFSTFPKQASISTLRRQNSKASYTTSTGWTATRTRWGASGSPDRVLQVMSSKEWLTIEDWLECTLPLCQLQIKHEGRLERCDEESLQVCFSSTKIGGKVLDNGKSQECISLVTFPEILPVLLHVEALEDNEALTVERVRHISRITDPKNRACLEKIEKPIQINVCCIDAEDYTHLPLSQHEEDNILRELNKCLLAFQQSQSKTEPNAQTPCLRQRRLSPIGESVGSSVDPPESTIPIITQQSCSTNRSGSESPKNEITNTDRLKVIEADKGLDRKTQTEGMLNNRRGRFIVLGSSGECLPVKRAPSAGSAYSSCSSSEEWHSAKTSLEGSGDEDYDKRYSIELETPERRQTFAQRLRDALRREKSSLSSSTESSYAVGISVAGSGVIDPEIKVKRGGSTGFMLREETLDEDFLKDSLQQEQQWIDKFKTKQSALSKRDSKSSEYSFSTEFSSELEEVYEQFSKWLNDPILETDKGTKRVLDQRDLAVVQFAGSLLKRTLSESFAGVPLTEGCESSSGCSSEEQKKSKVVLNARSLSLELARQKHRLAAQLLTQIAQKPKGSLKVVSTGNWGCGLSKRGEVQLKVIIQWLAASVAGVPTLVYYTCGHQELAVLDTVHRILRDRKWTVKDLTQSTLRYSSQVLQGRNTSSTLFEELIGLERTV